MERDIASTPPFTSIYIARTQKRTLLLTSYYVGTQASLRDPNINEGRQDLCEPSFRGAVLNDLCKTCI